MGGLACGLIADQITRRELAIFTQRRLEGHRHPRRTPHVEDAHWIDIDELTQFVNRWLTAEPSRQLTLGRAILVNNSMT